MFKSLHRVIHGMAWLMAVIGGIVMGALILMMCLSIIGRTATSVLHSAWMQENMAGFAQWLLDIGVGPIFGDYEFVVAGMAFSIFSFLGWCQLTAGHATVDVFTSALSDKSRRYLQVVIEFAFAVVLILIAYQLYQGMSSYMRRGSTTFLLQYPLWYNYALALIPAVITAIIGVYMAGVRIAEAVLNRTLVTVHGAEH